MNLRTLWNAKCVEALTIDSTVIGVVCIFLAEALPDHDIVPAGGHGDCRSILCVLGKGIDAVLISLGGPIAEAEGQREDPARSAIEIAIQSIVRHVTN